jgi:hypothetical protein
MRKEIERINSNQFVLSCFFSLIQQMIVASSTVWIVLLSNAVTSGKIFHVFLYLSFFILSLTLVYIPSTIMKIFVTKAQFAAYEKYIMRFQKNLYGFASLKNDEVFRRERQGYFNNESYLAISSTVFFLTDWLSLFLNISFNIIALSLVINKTFVFSYILTVPIILFVLKKSSGKIIDSNKRSQKERAGMFQTISSFWDTVLIGNRYNKRILIDRFNSDFNKSVKESTKAVFYEELTVSLTMVLSLLPVIGNLSYLIITGLDKMAIIISVIATLPRQIQLLQYLSDLVSGFTRWKGIKTKLDAIFEALEYPSDNSKGTIDWSGIYLETKNERIVLSSIEHLKEYTGMYSTGRYTLRGTNGSGKTTILATIKEIEKENAFFLPAQSSLVFSSIENKNLSTGEKMISLLDEIDRMVSENLLLLDEWDANLDRKNIMKISGKIDALAEKKCIIEVRHRTSGD